MDAGGLAEVKGVKQGDHILEVNGVNSMRLSHKQTVEAIRKAGSRVVLKLLSKVEY